MLDSYDLLLLGKALLAGALGFAIGWQRENSGSVAGDRTFALVSIGTAIVTAYCLATFPENADRLIGSAVTGVGFLGAGLIVRNAGGETRGLTTAAGLWVTTALAVLVGAGHFVIAVVLTALVLLVLFWENLPLVARLGLRITRSPSTDERTCAPGRVATHPPPAGAPTEESQGRRDR
jgi:putative Mg2+ transporter-C (MgtC) family protein